MLAKQITGETVGEVKAVADMHQRKAEMARNSDCFIALPGLSFFSFLAGDDRKILSHNKLFLNNFRIFVCLNYNN